MEIYISYFAQMRNFPPNMVGFSTAKFEPRWLRSGQSQTGIYWMGIPPLKPGIACDNLCNGHCTQKHPDTCAFLKAYRAQLDKINCKELVKKIEQNSLRIARSEGWNDVSAVILVYEAPQNPCSERRVLQEWFKDNGMELKEWHK